MVTESAFPRRSVGTRNTLSEETGYPTLLFSNPSWKHVHKDAQIRNLVIQTD